MTKTDNIFAMVDNYPGPALLCSGKGEIIHANISALDKLVSEKIGEGVAIADNLRAPIADIMSTNEGLNWPVAFDNKSEKSGQASSFMISGMPHNLPGSDETAVLLLAFETTLQASVRNALIDSRTFFRNLADCAGDFVWATDETGKFSYISPSGIGNMAPQDFHGGTAAEIFGEMGFEAIELFGTTKPVKDKDIWIDLSDQRRCYRFSAEPIYDKADKWSGARGVARDVTELKMKEAELARISQIDTMIAKVLHAARIQADPEDMLNATVNAVIEASELSACWIIRRECGKNFAVQTAQIIKSGQDDQAIQPQLEEAALRHALMVDGDETNTVEWADAGHDMIAVPLCQASELLGFVCFAIARVPKTDSAGLYDRHKANAGALACNITDQIAAAIVLAEQHENLKRLSHTDSLTGLLNRRAFYAEVRRRLIHHKRKQMSAALLYIDLDNFKDVNDTHGHASGDEILCTVARMIRSQTRQSDIAVRLGGDEFAVWLEEADQVSAELKAADLVEQSHELDATVEKIDNMAMTPKPRPGLGISIGIAIYNPAQPESLESVINRADSALYHAKATGKGNYHIAPELGEVCTLAD